MRHPTALIVATLLTLSFFPEKSAHANGVLPEAASSPPSLLNVEMAIAPTPFGSTRWSRITVGGASTSRVMWLVPARPGAAIDWASDAWLEALDDVSAPRIVPPTTPSPCGDDTTLPTTAERITSWTSQWASGTTQPPTNMTIETSASALRDHATQRGFAITTDLATRITALYARGFALVAFELAVPNGAVTSSPTIRVSDDGAATALPFALTGGVASETLTTVFTITSGAVTSAHAREVDPSAIVWGPAGSDYTARRANLLVQNDGAAGVQWVRESSSHDALFDAIPSAKMQSLMADYFTKANTNSHGNCEATAALAALNNVAVDRQCASGVVAMIPGGNACAPTNTQANAQAFTCGSGVDDLALALAGEVPSNVFVTRFSGRIAAASYGEDESIVSNVAARSPVIAAGAYQQCTAPQSMPPQSPWTIGGGNVGKTGSGVLGQPVVHHGTAVFAGGDDSCGASAVGVPGSDGLFSDDGDDNNSSGGDDNNGSDGNDDNNCTGSDDSSSTGSSSGSDDGNNKSDDDSTDNPHTSSLHPTCTSSKSLKSPTLTNAKNKAKKTSQNLNRRRPKEGPASPSPVSRFALFLGALLLPFRRKSRLEKAL